MSRMLRSLTLCCRGRQRPGAPHRPRVASRDLAEFYDRLVALEGAYRDSPDFTGQASPHSSGEPAAIVESLSADPSLALADTVLLTPLSELDTRQKEHVLSRVVDSVAVDLGRRLS